jgi:hypothetical protein
MILVCSNKNVFLERGLDRWIRYTIRDSEDIYYIAERKVTFLLHCTFTHSLLQFPRPFQFPYFFFGGGGLLISYSFSVLILPLSLLVFFFTI